MSAEQKAKYVSIDFFNLGVDKNGNVVEADATLDAVIDNVFPFPVVDNASDYVMAVERFELNLNGIPFYNGARHNESINLRHKVSTNEVNVLVDTDCFSLADLFTILQAITFPDPNGGGQTTRMQFVVNGTGFIVLSIISLYSFANITITFPHYMNLILGMKPASQIQGTLVQSVFPRFDCGDELNHILLTSNLNTVSDIVNTSLVNVLTDFAPNTLYTTAVSNVGFALADASCSLNTRQRAIYQPFQKRFLTMISPFAIQSIHVEAFYVTNDGNKFRVPLPLGGSFAVKLGFYKK